MHRRQLLHTGLALFFPAIGSAQSDLYPSKTVKFVNTFPPGGPSDILARSLAELMQKSWGQAIIVENKAGAGGNVGSDFVAKSAADGYTVLFGIDTTTTVNPYLYPNTTFKPSDLKTVMVLASSGLLVGVHPSTGIKSMNELMAMGKAKSKGLNFSSGGSGSPGHLAISVFSEATGININHIPYKGNTPAVMAVLAGEVDGGVLATPGMMPHVKAGKITALAVTGGKRSPLLPDVPTVAELGLKRLEEEVLYVVMLPAGTPEAVTQTLTLALTQALKSPELKTRLTNLDMHIEGLTGAAAHQRLSDLSQRYQRIIKATGMKVE